MELLRVCHASRVGFILALIVSAALVPAAPAEPAPPKDHQPAWFRDEPVVFVGNWDSARIFRTRKGGNPLWYDEAYALQHSEESVRKLKELGVTVASIHFYKGFGLDAEKEQLADARKLAALCHRYGIRVGVYIGSTIGYETFLLEKPEAAEWFVPDYLGRPVFYYNQSFRKRVYFQHPGYVDYMKRVVRLAIEDIGADVLEFDNTSLQARAEIFHHPLAKRHFREYLASKYTPAELKQRLGISDVTYVEPPFPEMMPGVINDPLAQEWADFRCRQLNNYYAEMSRFARSLKPDVLIDNNPHSGVSGTNTVWFEGVYYPALLPYTDMVCSEEGNDPGISKDGILISKIRSYRMASTLGNRIIAFTGHSRIAMAEAMAFNPGVLGVVGGMMAGYEKGALPEVFRRDDPYSWGKVYDHHLLTARKRRYIEFYRKYFSYYRDIENTSRVAVLHSYATMAFNEGRPYDDTFLFEQALIENHVPFDVIFDEQLGGLSRYRVLVLGSQEALSDKQMGQIRRFVRDGGGLVATGATSLFTPHRRQRRDFGLKDLFGFDAPLWLAGPGRKPAGAPALTIVRREHDRGRVVYIPQVVPSEMRPTGEPMTSPYWKTPRNADDLIDAVTWAAGRSLAIESSANPRTVLELTTARDSSALMLHLINYDAKAVPLLSNIEVRLPLPPGRSVERVEVLSPDREASETIPHRAGRERQIQFTIPRLEVYDLVVIHLKDLKGSK